MQWLQSAERSWALIVDVLRAAHRNRIAVGTNVMKRGEERQLDIRSIRDAAMSVIVKLGAPVFVQNITGRPVEASIEGFSISYLTPFQKTQELSDHHKYAAAKHGITWRPPPPYLLDIWLDPGPKVIFRSVGSERRV